MISSEMTIDPKRGKCSFEFRISKDFFLYLNLNFLQMSNIEYRKALRKK